MKKLFLVFFIVIFISGCAGFIEFLNIIVPDKPVPVCDKDSAGTVFQGKICLKYSDGSYRWTK